MPNKTPILLLAYNRPLLLQQVFLKVREYRPNKLFVAIDGPRSPEDAALVQQSQNVVSLIDWPCDVRTLFRDTNLGCRAAVETAIGWFFAHVEEGVILEDDCLPSNNFFPYCEELLPKYKDDERVLSISGESFSKHWTSTEASYSFSKYSLFCGWATWRRAWQCYDPALTNYAADLKNGWLAGYLGGQAQANYWKDKLDRTAAGLLDTWGYRWMFSHWANNALCVVPRANMISNTGYGPNATHTKDPKTPLSMRPHCPLTFPLTHPRTVRADFTLDAAIEDERFEIPKPGRRR